MKHCRVLLLVACLPVVSPAQVTDEARQCFEWFSTLGYPDVKDARWAEIWTGSYSTSGPKDPPMVHTTHGFITRESDTDFTIMRADLIHGTLKKSKPSTPAHQRVAFEEASFSKMIGEQLESLRNPPKGGLRRFGAKLGLKAELFFLAHVCWQRDETVLAAELFGEAKKVPLAYSAKRKEATMQEALEIELGHAAMWDTVLQCGGGSLGWNDWATGDGRSLSPRTELLEAFKRIIRLFPHCEHIERAKVHAAMLEQMVEEDRTHPAMSQEHLDQLPLDQRIAELIWRLRDQNGHQWGQPGWCDVFDMNRSGTSSAHQLLAIGYAAAPALIEALTDPRLSRSVGFHRDFHFSHTVLTIGDCAQQILARMTGQDFYSPGSTSGYMSNEEKMLAVQQVARKWWGVYQEKGKKQMLVDSIAAGTTSPSALIQQLEKEDSTAVAEAVIRGAENAKNDWMLRQFIGELARIKTQEATRLLVKIMKTDKRLLVRLDAAKRLLNAGHDDALPAILHEWGIFPAAASNGLRDGFEGMVEMLIASGDTEAMRKLLTLWDERPVYERFEIVRKLGEWLPDPAKEHSFSDVKARPASSEARADAIKLLVHALDDEESRDGMSGGIGDFSYSSPKICDFALWALNQIDGNKYPFSPQAGRRQRNEERIHAANVWRKEHQQPLLPPLPPPDPRLEPKDALRIVRVSITPPHGFESTPLVKQVMAMRGTNFGSTTLSSVLILFATNPVAGARGLKVEAVREGDLTGVELLLRFEPGDYPSNDESRDWSTRHSGQIGSSHLGSSGGSCSMTSARKTDFWDDFEEEIARGLKAPPETSFQISAGLSASK